MKTTGKKGEPVLDVAGELGLEPRLAESESAVLPLDDSPGGPKSFGSDRRFGKDAKFKVHDA